MNGENIIKVKVERDDIVDQICKNYTYDFREYIEFKKHIINPSALPKSFSIGLIVGTSGSGKSLLLNDMFGIKTFPKWDNKKPICSHFDSYDEAEEKLMGSGLNSIPSWLKPYNTLSNGQQYRADLSRIISSDVGIDEFSSVIDRATALGLSNSIQKLIRRKDYRNVVFASVHKDIIPYLQPDWVYNTDDKVLTINSEIYNLELNENKEVKLHKKKHFMEIL